MSRLDDLSTQQADGVENFPFALHEWEVSPTTLRIRSGDKIIKLEPKVMQVLAFLAEHAGEVVSRQTLEEEVWAGTVVGYDAITNTVIKLRKAFGDKSRQPRFIETIPKTGYRLIAEVIPNTSSVEGVAENNAQANGQGATVGELAEKPSDEAKKNGLTDKSSVASRKRLLNRSIIGTVIIAVCGVVTAIGFGWRPLSTPTALTTASAFVLPDKPSLAVMPFLNASNDPAQSYFSDGMTEDLITDLSNNPGLFVIARNSSFRYKGQAIDAKQVASELGVRFILQGSVRKSSDMVRINAQLTDSISGANVWAERYDSKLDDVFLIQDEVTQKITAALSVRLNEADSTANLQEGVNAASYDEFLRGWQYYWKFSRDDFAIAEQHFNKALELDENNSRAHAGLALIYWQSWQQKWHENLGNVHAGWRKASKALELAMVNPTPLAHSTKSAVFLYNRRFDEAIEEAEKAINMNGNHAMGYLALANALAYSGQPGRAIENAQKGMRLDPNFGAPYLAVIGRAQFDMGLYQKAVKSLNRALQFSPVDRNTLILLLASFGHLGENDKAQATLATLQQEHQAQKLRPFTIDWLTNRWPYRQKTSRDHLLQGLELASVAKW